MTLTMASDSLDTAWADAKAALPEGMALIGLIEIEHGRWQGIAHNRWDQLERDPMIQTCTVGGYGATPIAALRNLTAKLLKVVP